MWLYDTPMLCQERRRIPQPLAISDALLVSSNAAEGAGGLMHISPGSWWKGSTLTIIDTIGTTGLAVDSSCMLRSINDARCALILGMGSWGATWFNVSHEFSDVHDIKFIDGSIYMTSTGTNEVVKTSLTGEVEQRWTFAGGSNSWHVNCLDVWEGRLVATIFGRFTGPNGYLAGADGTGAVIDVQSGETIMDGFCKPHSPRSDGPVRYVLDSGRGRLIARNGPVDCVEFGDCFPRGLAVGEKMLYVGLSRLRNLPSQANQNRTAEIALLEKSSLKLVGKIAVPFNEIFDIAIVNES